MLDDDAILKAAAADIDEKLNSIKLYEKDLQPYIKVVEFGLQQGILDDRTFKDNIMSICEISIEYKMKDALVKSELDRNDWNEIMRLSKNLAARYQDVATGVAFLLAFFNRGKLLAGLPESLKETFGEEAFEAATNQYELDKLAGKNGDEGNILSI